MLLIHGLSTMEFSWKKALTSLLSSFQPKSLISHSLPVKFFHHLKLMTKALPLLVPGIPSHFHDCSFLFIKNIGNWLIFSHPQKPSTEFFQYSNEWMMHPIPWLSGFFTSSIQLTFTFNLPHSTITTIKHRAWELSCSRHCIPSYAKLKSPASQFSHSSVLTTTSRGSQGPIQSPHPAFSPTQPPPASTCFRPWPEAQVCKPERSTGRVFHSQHPALTEALLGKIPSLDHENHSLSAVDNLNYTLTCSSLFC